TGTSLSGHRCGSSKKPKTMSGPAPTLAAAAAFGSTSGQASYSRRTGTPVRRVKSCASRSYVGWSVLTNCDQRRIRSEAPGSTGNDSCNCGLYDPGGNCARACLSHPPTPESASPVAPATPACKNRRRVSPPAGLSRSCGCIRLPPFARPFHARHSLWVLSVFAPSSAGTLLDQVISGLDRGGPYRSGCCSTPCSSCSTALTPSQPRGPVGILSPHRLAPPGPGPAWPHDRSAATTAWWQALQQPGRGPGRLPSITRREQPGGIVAGGLDTPHAPRPPTPARSRGRDHQGTFRARPAARLKSPSPPWPVHRPAESSPVESLRIRAA